MSNQENLKVSSRPNRFVPRYRRVQEAVMDNRKTEDVVFEMIAGGVMVIAAMAITALLCQLIMTALPVLESMLMTQLAAQSASRTLIAVFAHADDEGAASPILARY